jgi:hypothetical protein
MNEIKEENKKKQTLYQIFEFILIIISHIILLILFLYLYL